MGIRHKLLTAARREVTAGIDPETGTKLRWEIQRVRSLDVSRVGRQLLLMGLNAAGGDDGTVTRVLDRYRAKAIELREQAIEQEEGEDRKAALAALPDVDDVAAQLQLLAGLRETDMAKMRNMEEALVCAGVRAVWEEGDGNGVSAHWHPVQFVPREEDQSPPDGPLWVGILPPETMQTLATAIYEHSGAQGAPFCTDADGGIDVGRDSE